jgi:hypothetical protein
LVKCHDQSFFSVEKNRGAKVLRVRNVGSIMASSKIEDAMIVSF